MRIYATIACLLLAALLLPACSSTPTDTGVSASTTAEPASYLFPAKLHAEVHAAAVEVLRDYGFRVARNDYRFGIITSYPKESPTLAELWVNDATTTRQRLGDTLNAQQRTIKITITRFKGLDSKLGASGETDLSDVDRLPFRLTAEVLVHRLQKPARYLTHSATGQLSASYGSVPTHLAQRGIDGTYAQVLTRDPLLERRLVDSIQAKVSR